MVNGPDRGSIMECIIEGCEKHRNADGLCNKHWMRNYRNGSPDIVKSVRTPDLYDKNELRIRSHELYDTWKNMISRCHNKKNIFYKHYGGRGISVCQRWRNLGNFILDMGKRPEGLTLDRINNDGNYEPTNCKWSTRVEQRANRRESV